MSTFTISIHNTASECFTFFCSTDQINELLSCQNRQSQSKDSWPVMLSCWMHVKL